jgi:uncharacterized protein YndB with AHSA1/START domain
MPRAAASASETIAGVGSDAVKKATGKTWAQWLALLDKEGATGMTHKEIAALLHEKHGVPGWWAQSVTVGYEQARGLRQKHEKPEGFQISASKTINVPVGVAFASWNDQKSRRRWLPGALMEVRKATADKSMRITWEPEGASSNVDVYFTAKAEDKCLVAVNHGKLKSAAAGEKMKKFWGERLAALKELLEA